MKTAVMRLEDITPADYNPRIKLKSGDTEYEALKNSIERFGLVEPLIVNERNNVLVGGHQRYNVLLESGAEEADVVLIDLDENQEKALNISLNKIESDWDTYKLEEVLRELDNSDKAFTGFSEEEIDNIIGLNNEAKLNDIIEDASSYDVHMSEGEIDDEETEPNFDIYLSFPNKGMAEAFLRKEEIKAEINERLRSVTVHMEEYGC